MNSLYLQSFTDAEVRDNFSKISLCIHVFNLIDLPFDTVSIHFRFLFGICLMNSLYPQSFTDAKAKNYIFFI